jgi:ATP-dependent metalloprotease
MREGTIEYGVSLELWLEYFLTIYRISCLKLRQQYTPFHNFFVDLIGSLRTRTAQNNAVQPQHQTVRFADVHGCDEVKEEL